MILIIALTFACSLWQFLNLHMHFTLYLIIGAIDTCAPSRYLQCTFMLCLFEIIDFVKNLIFDLLQCSFMKLLIEMNIKCGAMGVFNYEF